MDGKVIALTGAGSGIGEATAKLLAARGATLSLCDISESNLDRVVKELKGAGHLATRVDVSKSSEVEAWIEKTVSQLGKLDGAANVAGIFRLGSTAEQSDQDWDAVVNVNARGVFYCMRSQVNSIKDGGSIVNVASVAGLFGLAGAASYIGSKHAVVGLTKSTASEVGHRRIRVNAVAPGFIETPMLRATDEANGHPHDLTNQALQRHGKPEEIARVIAFLLSDDASFVTGTCLPVDGGWSA